LRASRIAWRVAARFLLADQGPGARKDTKDLVKPINSPKGISKTTIKDCVTTHDDRDDAVAPDRRDLRPEDVFQPKPMNMNVRDLVNKGWPGVSDDYQDMQTAIRKQIPKDKGYATVKNLSQYLVETSGGGGTKPVGK
jgi:hypothetical protein